MISDKDRREVARRLRDDAKGGALPYSDFFGAVAYDVGVDKEHAAVLNRLADLIDPPTQCQYYHSDRHYCSAYDDVVDRNALLELADEFVEKAEEVARYIESSDGDFDRHAIDAMNEQYGYASRIREALGVDE